MRLIQSNQCYDSEILNCFERREMRVVIGKERKFRILVVDDSVDSTDSVAALLRMLGYTVRVAYSGQSALEFAAEFEPDLVLLDIGMPVMNGNEVARCLRQQPQLKTTRLIAISGLGRESDRQKSRDAGFDDYLVKPFSPEELLKLIAGPTAEERAGPYLKIQDLKSPQINVKPASRIRKGTTRGQLGSI